jgi:hypothetical protein
MNVEFLAPARVEFAEAVMYDETQRTGLGDECAVEGQRTIERILQYTLRRSHCFRGEPAAALPTGSLTGSFTQSEAIPSSADGEGTTGSASGSSHSADQR